MNDDCGWVTRTVFIALWVAMVIGIVGSCYAALTARSTLRAWQAEAVERGHAEVTWTGEAWRVEWKDRSEEKP